MSDVNDLIQFIKDGKTQEALDLIKNGGINLNAKDKDGNTALLQAAYWSNSEVVKALIDKGADINAKDRFGRTALMEDIQKGNTDVVNVLIENKADVNMRDENGHTALDILKQNESQFPKSQYNKLHYFLSQTQNKKDILNVSEVNATHKAKTSVLRLKKERD